MRISQFLNKLHWHGQHDAAELAADFRAKTGREACWPTAGTVVAYQVAERLAAKYVPRYRRRTPQMGAAYREIVKALAEVGH
jgi:hypothetical protein